MIVEALYEQNGLTIEILTKTEDKVQYISGGNSKCPTWEEYKNDFKEYFWPHLELLKHAITEQGWIGETAEKIANYYCFKFSTGEVIGFTWRAWGDLMQAIINKKEGYMTYYI